MNVWISGVEKWGNFYNPMIMFDANGMIKANIQPFSSNRSLSSNEKMQMNYLYT